MIYLSDEKLTIGQKTSIGNTIDFSQEIEALGWKDFPCKTATTAYNSNYYKFLISNADCVAVSKDAVCEIRKIKKGYLEGLYVFIEKRANNINIEVIGPKTRLRFPTIQNNEGVEIDELFSNESIQALCVSLLHKFSVTKTYQSYQAFCDELPRKCFEDKSFISGISKTLGNVDAITLEDGANRKYVNIEACAQDTKDYFKKLATKKLETARELR